MKAYLKSKLRPFIGKRARTVLNDLRGIKGGSFSHETVAKLVAKPDPTILEIGCNDGSDTLELLRLMPAAKVYCFEPDPRAVTRLKQRFGPDLHKITLSEIAIADKTGPISFYPSTGDDRAGDFDQAGSIRTPKNTVLESPWVKFTKPITIKASRLDDWCAENHVREIDFLWMDVQGAEGDVIAGAQNILPHVRYVYTEYSNNELYEGQLSFRQLVSRLPSFEVLTRFPGDVLLKNRYL